MAKAMLTVTVLCVVMAALMFVLSSHLFSEVDYARLIFPGFVPENIYSITDEKSTQVKKDAIRGLEVSNDEADYASGIKMELVQRNIGADNGIPNRSDAEKLKTFNDDNAHDKGGSGQDQNRIIVQPTRTTKEDTSIVFTKSAGLTETENTNVGTELTKNLNVEQSEILIHAIETTNLYQHLKDYFKNIPDWTDRLRENIEKGVETNETNDINNTKERNSDTELTVQTLGPVDINDALVTPLTDGELPTYNSEITKVDISTRKLPDKEDSNSNNTAAVNYDTGADGKASPEVTAGLPMDFEVNVNDKTDIIRPNQEIVDLKESNQSKGSHYNLIINTYMRCGSSFLGSLFSKRSDVFYVYEPLWQVQRFAYFHGQETLCAYTVDACSPQGTAAVKAGVGGPVTSKEGIKYLHSLLNCSFYKYRSFLPDMKHFPNEFKNLKYSWNFFKGFTTSPYQACAKRGDTTYEQCFGLVKPICKAAKHHVLKVLRSSLDNFEPMLERSPDLKVVQLFRDPRGIFNSHMHTGFFSRKVDNNNKLEDDIKVTCRRMYYDVIVAERLLKKYPGRFRVVQYEDFFDLKHKAESLYNFMEMDITDTIMQSLEELINPKNVVQGFHPYSYRQSLPWNYERMAFKYCQKVYTKLGYPIFDNEHEYKNKPDSEVIKPLPYSL